MKIFEKIKDILYDSIDYVIMLAIVVVVIAVIGWRLDVLFAKDATDIHNKDTVIVDTTTRPPSSTNTNENELDEDEDEDVIDEAPEIAEPPTEEPPSNITTGPTIRINIPAGSLPGKIGLILEENGLVSSSRDFISKAVALKLDTKLKSGTFDIKQGMTTEEILEIITK